MAVAPVHAITRVDQIEVIGIINGRWQWPVALRGKVTEVETGHCIGLHKEQALVGGMYASDCKGEKRQRRANPSVASGMVGAEAELAIVSRPGGGYEEGRKHVTLGFMRNAPSMKQCSTPLLADGLGIDHMMQGKKAQNLGRYVGRQAAP
ncbi:hypothetical protein L7F22_009128 [Adiantum nelumboides]|nr:hypothetical protein [Adiantum nelumboides]